MITERIEKRQKEKEELQAQLAIEMNKQVRLSAPDIRAYLYALKHCDKNDENTKRGIINIFLRAVYLFDETFTLILNGSDKPIVIDDILLDEIEEGLDDDLANHNLCSPLVADAPPNKKARRKACLFVWEPQAHFNARGRQSRPCAKVLPKAKHLYGAKAPPRRAGPHILLASIVLR